MEELFFDFFDDGLCTYKNCSGPYKITYSKMSVEITPMELNKIIGGEIVEGALVTQPMLQLRPNQMELRLMVSKSFFNADSKNVNKKFLHHHS